MSILEILSQHIADVCNHGDIECRCGEQCDTPEDHRKHLAQVLDQHERERCYEAWREGVAVLDPDAVDIMEAANPYREHP